MVRARAIIMEADPERRKTRSNEIAIKKKEKNNFTIYLQINFECCKGAHRFRRTCHVYWTREENKRK